MEYWGHNENSPCSRDEIADTAKLIIMNSGIVDDQKFSDGLSFFYSEGYINFDTIESLHHAVIYARMEYNRFVIIFSNG